MCGIFGIINTKEKIDEGRVLSARDILAHRGPDDAGIYLSHCHTERVTLSEDEGRSVNDNNDYTVALAHRRLSIIDLSPSAHQPMTTPDGRYTIVYNGEIYNYKDLFCHSVRHRRIDPESMRSNSDTEVILNLYIQYGKDCLNMLRGMFAFAIWDDKEKTLFAARDRFGIKPFYYLKNDSEFIFSSEIKAIKHYKNNLTLSTEGIDAFLRIGSVPAPLTIYEEVASLLPGHYLEIRPFDSPDRSGQAAQGDKPRMTIKKYWRFGDLLQSNNNSTSFPRKWESKNTESVDSRFHGNDKSRKYDDEVKKKIRTALLDTIKAHMVSDVEVGAFLSGGIDSTAIVSLMRQAGQEKIKTVSVVFPGNKLDESKYARLAAKTYNTEHIEIPFYEKDLLEDFDKIMAAMDQPTIDGINTYFVSKAAKQAGLKVVLSGLGGDELFGGYPSFKLIPKYNRIKNLPFAKTFMKAAAPLLKNRLPAKAIEYMRNPNTQNSEYKLIRGLFTDSELQQLGWSCHPERSRRDVISTTEGRRNLTDKISQSTAPSSEGMPLAEMTGLSELQNISYLESCYYMRNQLLRDSDVFSMAHSIELRVPFVDHLLYAAVLPYLDAGYDKNFPKKMLVDAVGDIPLELINRPKMGFTFPFADWIKEGNLNDRIQASFIRLSDKNMFSKESLDSYFNNYKLNKVHWSRVWALFVISKFI